MRVYELARETGVTSAEVIRLAESAGVRLSSAVSTVEESDEEKVRAAVSGADRSKTKTEDIRAAKLRRAEELNAEFFAAQKAKLAEHLRLAREAAEVDKATPDKKSVQAKQAQPAAAEQAKQAQPAAEQAKPAAQPKYVIRMAPGCKPKPLPTVSAAQTGLTAKGFKPL